jgi:hypothetical protein
VAADLRDDGPSNPPKAHAFHFFFNGSAVFSCQPQMMLAQAVFASQSRLSWAHDSGVSILPDAEGEMQTMGYLAGLFADKATLAAAQALDTGLSVTSNSVACSAAASGCTVKMEWPSDCSHCLCTPYRMLQSVAALTC